MFMRYNITSDADKVEALKRLPNILPANRRRPKNLRRLSRCQSVRLALPPNESADKTRTIRPHYVALPLYLPIS